MEALRIKIDNLGVINARIEIIRRQSILKSAVYSARIEGFKDTVVSPKQESQNLLAAYNAIFLAKQSTKFSVSLIRQFHKQTLKNISGSAGELRTEPWAVFNESGVAVHIAPLHTLLPSLMVIYVKYINSLTSHVAVSAAIAQFIFEKIHPFADGNGRVGRLISTLILKIGGYDLKGLAPMEEYINDNRGSYYASLEPSHTITLFIEFFLEALVNQCRKTLNEVQMHSTEESETYLSPRRQEIILVIGDHPYCTFDFLHRRFANINPKTLHYDLAMLKKAGLIKKSGTTKGASYFTAKSNQPGS